MAKVAIVGCGAMGSVYAGLMADAGHDVHAVTLWADHAAAMAQKGLRVEGASGDRTVRLRSSGTSTDGIGICDLVIIATKAYDVEAAATATLTLLGPETVVQTIQNGLGSAEKVAPIVSKDRLAIGVVGGFGASLRAPGHVHHNGMEVTWFGAFAGLARERLEASARIWDSSGFKVGLYEDVQSMVWEKLIMNVAVSGPACATGMTIGQIMKNPDAWRMASGCAAEAILVARAAGVKLKPGDPMENMMRLAGKIPNARPSMLLDAIAGRRCEIDAINGAVTRLGGSLGIPTPVNDTLVAIIKAREALYDQ
jgi:2-dehydropantoate 2-reductase